jgi:nucleotide-binding universal stress UspA family protein
LRAEDSMSAIRNILFGTDFSEVSESALVRVLDLARAVGASVDVVHVYALPVFNLPIEGAVMPTATYAAKLTDRLQQSLDATLARYGGAGVPLQGHLRTGAPHDELVRAAGELGADVIAIGTHARTGAAHAFLGSVAERVVRHADRPVLTLPPSRV